MNFSYGTEFKSARGGVASTQGGAIVFYAPIPNMNEKP
jgi:hypothetical protein